MFVKHIVGILGMSIGHGFGAHAAGWAAGEAIQRGIQRASNARQMGAAKDLFLSKRAIPELNPQYERAAAVLGHAAMPLPIGGP